MDEMEEIRMGVEMERQATEGFRFKGSVTQARSTAIR